MPLLLNRSTEDLMAIAIERMEEANKTSDIKITNKPGSVVRLFLAIINDCLAGFYDQLQAAHLMSFLSTASGDGLDLIGELVQCTRGAGEEDSEYQFRISQQVTSLEMANETSVKLAVLSLPGIQDATIKKFTHGTGSYSVFLITESGVVSEDIVGIVSESLDKVTAYGTKFSVSAPDLVEISIHIKLIFNNTVSNEDGIKEQVKAKISEYINSRQLQETLIFNEMIEVVMAVSDDIYDMDVIHYSVDDKPVLNVNQECRWNERFVQSPKPDSIIIL